MQEPVPLHQIGKRPQRQPVVQRRTADGQPIFRQEPVHGLAIEGIRAAPDAAVIIILQHLERLAGNFQLF